MKHLRPTDPAIESIFGVISYEGAGPIEIAWFYLLSEAERFAARLAEEDVITYIVEATATNAPLILS